jgi:hypothetical protein
MRTVLQRAAALVAMVVVALIGLFSFSSRTAMPTASAQAPRPTPASVATPAPQAFDQKAALAKLREQIKGHEKDPAPQVFKNIQTPFLKGGPADRVLSVMETGYSRTLGVDCTHCHVPDKWESDEKSPKQVARDMGTMMAKINTELLPGIKNLNQNAFVNCFTCHRGDLKPALSLPQPPKAN